MRNVWICAGLFLLALLSPGLRADQGDVEGSRDYPGFPRLPGFFIADYDEDNPGEYNFPIARPTPTDANHVETFTVKGHRYIIRYELTTEEEFTVLKIQQYYENLASDSGYTLEKTGAIGDVTETFHRRKRSHDIWVHLELDPRTKVIVITAVESYGPALPPGKSGSKPAAAPQEMPTKAQAEAPTETAPMPVPKPKKASSPTPAPTPTPEQAVEETPVRAPISEDALYDTLESDGRAVLPISFLPGKPDISSDAQPMINRVIKILKEHPEMYLTIEGHTDNVGEASDNQRLSSERARAVRALLIAGGIEKKRLMSAGKGGAHPVADNATAEGRAKNRRIELVVRQDAEALHPAAPNGTNYYPKTGAGSP